MTRQDPWNIPAHPAAELFPMMSETDLRSLAENIRVSGQLQPIVLIEEDGTEKVLDGRNRQAACQMAGVEPKFIVFKGSDPYALVVSANLNRRHLSESQRAMVAADIARLRQGRRQANASIDAFEASSQDDAAKLLKVGRSTVQRARRVKEDGVPELGAAVVAGELTVNAAHKIARLPHDEQRQRLAEGSPKRGQRKPEAAKAAAEEVASPRRSKRWFDRRATDATRYIRDWAIECTRKHRYPMSEVISVLEQVIEGLQSTVGESHEQD